MSLAATIYLFAGALLAYKVTRWVRGVKPRAWPFTTDFI